MRQRCLPHIGMFSFLHRECINLHKGRLRNKMHLHSNLKGCFFVLKAFDQSQELKTIAKKSLWMNICTALWSFVNCCCLSQSEVSTDSRIVSTFFAFQHVRCRCCYRCYLDRFLIPLTKNSVPGIGNSWRGTHPRLSWIPLHGILKKAKSLVV